MQPEDLVVPIRARFRERQCEQAARLQVAEHGGTVDAVQDPVTQRTGQAPQDTGSHQELAQRTRQIRDDVAGQVIAGQP